MQKCVEVCICSPFIAVFHLFISLEAAQKVTKRAIPLARIVHKLLILSPGGMSNMLSYDSSFAVAFLAAVRIFWLLTWKHFL